MSDPTDIDVFVPLAVDDDGLLSGSNPNREFTTVTA
jgi:hypothetical protein